MIDWKMAEDGTFQFSYPQPQFSPGNYYYLDYVAQDVTSEDTHDDDDDVEYVVESDPYDDVFSVNGHDLPAYSSEVYDSQINNTNYYENIVKF